MPQKKKTGTLGNFRIKEEMDDYSDDIGASMYRKEINSLKIEKIGNRVTLISVILPCLIGAILFFAYLDIKERFVNVHDTGQNNVETIAEELEAKLNGMNVDLAKLEHALKVKLPGMEKNIQNIETEIAQLTSLKADKKQIETSIKSIKKRVTENSSLYKTSLNIIDRTNNKTISIINETTGRLKKKITQIDSSLKLKLAEIKDSIKKDLSTLSNFRQTLAEYEKKIALARKDITLGENNIKALREKTIDKEYLNKELLDLKSQYKTKFEKLFLEISKISQKNIIKQTPDLKD
ncbi:MAG: hypothetical protein U9N77_15705, partial [Thermodesulfobacteriota bacterium]|nr:hypothetical protein [Thermodesulfobacteriota bacterium]